MDAQLQILEEMILYLSGGVQDFLLRDILRHEARCVSLYVVLVMLATRLGSSLLNKTLDWPSKMRT